MYELDKMQYVNPIFNFSLDGKIKEDNGRLRRTTRRDIKESAKNIANTLSSETGATVYDYLKNNITLKGSKGRQRLFNKTIQKELAPYILDPTKMDAKTLSSLSPEEKAAVSRYWRDPKRLIGQIGGGIEDPIANQHAREYVEGLVKPAVVGIGGSMLGTNPITTTLLNEGLSGAKGVIDKALPYVDDGVSAVNNWLGKQTQWWNPVQWGRVLLDPTKANTAFGQGVGVGADLYGIYESGKDLNNLGNKWTSGQFDWSDIPQAGLDVAGMLPGFSYLKNAGVSVGKGLSRYADDVADSYRMLVNGEEPVLGITPGAGRRTTEVVPREVEEFRTREAANRMREQYRNIAEEAESYGMNFNDFESSDHNTRFLPDLPEEVFIEGLQASETGSRPPIVPTFAPRPVQISTLSPEVIQQLRSRGLGRYDIQNLLDRGFSPEQMMMLSNTRTGVTSNRRANILAQRLADMGEVPSLPTRQAYLHSIVDEGNSLLEYNGRPYSLEEWLELPETAGLNPFEHEWGTNTTWIDNVLFGGRQSMPSSVVAASTPSVNPRRIFVENPEFYSLRKKLNKTIQFFGKDQFMEVQPQLKQIIEEGIASGKSPADIESEIANLYAKYDKPFGFDKNKFGQGRATAERRLSHGMLDWIFNGNPNFEGATHVRVTPYASVDELSPVITDSDLIGSPSHLNVIAPSRRDLAVFSRDMRDAIPHGGVAIEHSKSLQSSPMAHKQYADRIRKGEGVGSFLRTPDGKYVYQDTNGIEGTRWSPKPDGLSVYDKTFKINAPTIEEHMSRNIEAMEDYLNEVHPSTFDDLGYPLYQVTLGDEVFDLPIVRKTIDGKPRLVIQRSEDLSKAIADADANIESQVNYQAIKNDFFDKAKALLANRFPDRKLTLNWGDFGELVAVDANSGETIRLGYLKEMLPELADLIDQTSFKLNRAMFNVRHPNLSIYQPIAAMRVKKHGGKIIDNLNPSIKTLLNIK